MSGSAGALYHPAVAHIYLVHQGINLSHETLQFLTYDDSSQLLMVVKGGHVFAYETHGESAHNLRWMYPLQEGPPVQGMRCTTDMQILAVQRSAVLIEFVNLETGNIFIHGTHRGKGHILGFFFAESPETDFVLVTNRGLELCQFNAKRTGLHLRETIRVQPHVHWHLYTHETRMALLGGGASGARMQGFQFTVSGVIHLPMFEIRQPPHLLSSPSPAVTQQQVKLVKLYGRVYLTYIDRENMRLELYRFYTDTVVLQHTYELFAPQAEVSVVDNLVVTHQPTADVVMLFDVLAEGAQPIANPLPMAVIDRVPSRVPSAADADETSFKSEEVQTVEASPFRASRVLVESVVHDDSWIYAMPNIVLDVRHKRLFKMHLGLQSLAESCSDKALLVGVLQRRRQSHVPLLQCSPKQLLIAVLREAVREESPPARLAKIFDQVNHAYAAALQSLGGHEVGHVPPEGHLASGTRGALVQQESPLTPSHCTLLSSCILSPAEMMRELFQWSVEEQAVDQRCLQAAITEYLISANSSDLVVPQQLEQLLVDLLVGEGLDYQVVQLVTLMVRGGSKDLAVFLEDLGKNLEGSSRTTLKVLAANLLSSPTVPDQAQSYDRSATELLINQMICEGKVVPAARLARHRGVNSIAPHIFLEAAAQQKDLGSFASVYRLYSQSLSSSFPTLLSARSHFNMG